MPYRAIRVSGRCRPAGHPAPPSKQPPGQGAPYVSEGNVKIHNRQDGKETIIYAELDMNLPASCKMEHDAVGHYSRPDVLELKVNEL